MYCFAKEITFINIIFLLALLSKCLPIMCIYDLVYVMRYVVYVFCPRLSKYFAFLLLLLAIIVSDTEPMLLSQPR